MYLINKMIGDVDVDIIKINNWSELDGKKNYTYTIRIRNKFISIEFYSGLHKDWARVSDINYDSAKKEQILMWLSWFGFHVKFEKPINVTQEEKIILKALEKGWIVKDEFCDHVDFYRALPKRINKDGGWADPSMSMQTSLRKGLFSFITWESDPFCIENFLATVV